MSIFDKIFGKKKDVEKPQVEVISDSISPDNYFVDQFKKKGGKFLYSDDRSEILVFLKNIMEENAWNEVKCIDKELIGKLKVVDIQAVNSANVFFTKCEHLIVEDGSILFSSKQLKDEKLTEYPINFVVYATTSQLIRDKDKALSSIKFRYQSNIPTNISAVKDYQPNKVDDDFMNYGNNNSKNLYLLLLEDL